MSDNADRPNRPRGESLRRWRAILRWQKIRDKLRGLIHTGQGTEQRKYRWDRERTLTRAKTLRTRKRRARTALTKQLHRNRKAKHQNHLTGAKLRR